jgi:glutamate carboxypeptidase
MSTQSMASKQPKASPQLSVWDVEQYVQDRLPRYLEELSDLCAIDSGTYNKAGIDMVALSLAKRMRSLGMEVSLCEQDRWGNDLYAILPGEGPGKVTLLGHIDTVYPVGTAAARPVQVQGHKVLGPGVYDMKGCILSAIYAIEALLAQDYRHFGEIHFLCVTDEEISEERHSKGLIWQACQNSQGVLVLEGARENGDLVSARKGGSWYKLSAHGHCAHAGVEPEKGSNAIVELAHQIMQFQSLNGWREGVTINLGRISGGTATNVVPDYAEVSIDLRFLQHADCYDTEQRWHEMMRNKSIPGVQLTLQRDSSCRDPMECTPQSLRLVHSAQRIAQQLGFEVDHAATGGISDANYVSSFGLPILDGLGPIGDLDHSPDEYIELESIAPRAALLAGLIAAIGE